MARRTEYPSNAEMLDYLYGKGVSYSPRSTDPIQRQAYLQRLYRNAKAQEAKGETFSRAKARGHAPRVEHIAKKGKVAEQYRAKGTKKNPLNPADIEGLYKQANPNQRRRGNISGSITGLIKYQNPVSGQEELVEKTYGFAVDAKTFEELISSGADALEIAKAISGLPWEYVYSINVKSY